jgi:hypothetical protein
MWAKLCAVFLCSLLLPADGRGSKSVDERRSAATAGRVELPPLTTASDAAAGAIDADLTKKSQSGVAGAVTNRNPAFDACSLIKAAEVGAVQNDKITGTKSSSRFNGTFAVSQCFYTAANFVNSVSLEVNQGMPDDSQRNSVLQFWTQQFRQAKDNRKSVKPKLIPGIGDEAYWVGSSKMGALYILKRGRYFRVSVGGPDAEEVKLQKSKKLAAYALKRL